MSKDNYFPAITSTVFSLGSFCMAAYLVRLAFSLPERFNFSPTYFTYVGSGCVLLGIALVYAFFAFVYIARYEPTVRDPNARVIWKVRGVTILKNMKLQAASFDVLRTKGRLVITNAPVDM